MEEPIAFVSKFSYVDYCKCLSIMRREWYIVCVIMDAGVILMALFSPMHASIFSYVCLMVIYLNIQIWGTEWRTRKRSHYERQFRLWLDGQSFAFYPTHFTVECEREGYRSQTSLAYGYIYSATITQEHILLFNSTNVYYYQISLANLSQPQREDLKALLRQNIRRTIVTSQ